MTAGVAPEVARAQLGAAQVAAGRRFDALDGVRALAVSAVLAVHALPNSGVPGGIGVDVFFVLSGYLITTLLLAEHDRHGRVDLPRFYLRRLLRLAPALLVLLVALYPLGRELVGGAYLGRALLVAQFRGNLALTLQHQSIAPLDHAWSLGQEAQFYLVWPPLLLAAVALRLSRRALVGGLLVLAAVVFRTLVAVQTAPHAPVADFRLDVRAGGLLVGCALAVALRDRPALLARPGLAELGLAGLVGLLMVGTPLHAPLQVAVPVAVVATALLIGGLLAGPRGTAAGLLSLPAPVYLGRISYSLYLWHYPFFLAFQRRSDLPRGLVLLLEVVFALAAAAMSYAVVEHPVARWSARRLAGNTTKPPNDVVSGRAAIAGVQKG